MESKTELNNKASGTVGDCEALRKTAEVSGTFLLHTLFPQLFGPGFLNSWERI